MVLIERKESASTHQTKSSNFYPISTKNAKYRGLSHPSSNDQSSKLGSEPDRTQSIHSKPKTPKTNWTLSPSLRMIIHSQCDQNYLKLNQSKKSQSRTKSTKTNMSPAKLKSCVTQPRSRYKATTTTDS